VTGSYFLQQKASAGAGVSSQEEEGVSGLKG